MPKTAVIYNPSSGSSSTSLADLKKAFKQYDGELFFLEITKGIESLTKQIQNHKIKIIVAAGGDGTVNAVANIAVVTNTSMAILPLGTLNHFAKDLGLPIDLDEAVAVIATGKPVAVDYCTVNDTVFINNSSVGVYPITVAKREKISGIVGKWPAAFVATVHALMNLRILHLEFRYDGKKKTIKTPMVFVGNNKYDLDRVGLAQRSRIDTGLLFLYVIRTKRLIAMMQLVISIMVGKRDSSKDLHTTTKELEIHSRKKALKVSMDGEVKSMTTPLIYKAHPAGLKVYTIAT